MSHLKREVAENDEKEEVGLSADVLLKGPVGRREQVLLGGEALLQKEEVLL